MNSSGTDYYLGVDVGTTNAKVVLIDSDAHVVRSAAREYVVDYPRAGWAEQKPEMWWAAVCELMHEVLDTFAEKTAIRVLGVSGQMHGLVALDRTAAVVRPAILWNDQRTHSQCQAIIEKCGGLDGLVRLTNNHMLTGYTAPKILWMREKEPDSFARIARVLLPKDYIRHRLTGDFTTDVSDASGTGLFDVARRQWSSELLELLELPQEWFPRACESTEVVGHLRPEVAADFGLPPTMPVIAGAGDAALQPLGSGLLDASEGLLVVGTGGNVTVPLAACVANEAARLQVFCGVLPGSYVAMGATLTAGESMRWIRDLLRSGTADLGCNGSPLGFGDLDRLAGGAEPGAGRSLFLPYLLGERCPHADTDARGAFLGLSPGTSLGDLVRAVMEGVAFSLRDVSALLEAQQIQPGAFRLSGGGSRSKLWRRIFASVFDARIGTVAASAEGTAYGAALLAGISQGRWSDAAALEAVVPAQTVDLPEPALVARYGQMFSVYQKGYASLSALCRELAACS